jgi:hypothetical protein
MRAHSVGSRSAADAIENRDIGSGVDKAGDPLELGAMPARDRQRGGDVPGVRHLHRIRIAAVDRGARRGATRERGTRGAERKHRNDNGGSAHMPGHLVLAGTVAVSMAPVDCRGFARRF